MTSTRLRERLIAKQEKGTSMTATQPSQNSVSSMIKVDFLNGYHQNSLRMAKESRQVALISGVVMSDGTRHMLTSREQLAELEQEQIKAIFLDVGRIKDVRQSDGTLSHGIDGGEMVTMYPNRSGYEARCGCAFSAQTREDRFTGAVEGNTCIHMMRALYALEPELIKARAAEWQVEAKRRESVNNRLALRLDQVEELPDF